MGPGWTFSCGIRANLLLPVFPLHFSLDSHLELSFTTTHNTSTTTDTIHSVIEANGDSSKSLTTTYATRGHLHGLPPAGTWPYRDRTQDSGLAIRDHCLEAAATPGLPLPESMPAELITFHQNGTKLSPPTMPTQGSSSSRRGDGDGTIAGAPDSMTSKLQTEVQQHVTQSQKRFIKRYRTEVAASASSVLSTLATFPLDSVKTRMQTYKYSGFVDCVRHTYQTEKLKGFFRGKFGASLHAIFYDHQGPAELTTCGFWL